MVVAERPYPPAETLRLAFLLRESAHHPDAGEVLLQDRRHLALGTVGLLEQVLDPGEEDVSADGKQRQQADGVPGEVRVQPEEDGHDGQHQQARAADLDHVRGQEHAHRLDVRTAALDEVARVRVVEELRAQVMQPPKELLPQPPADRLRRHRGPQPAQEEKEAADRGDGDARQGRHDEVRQVRVGRSDAFGDGHEQGRAQREVALVHDVDRVLGDERRAEHQHVRDRHRDDRARVSCTLAPGDGPEAGSFFHAFPSDEGSPVRGPVSGFRRNQVWVGSPLVRRERVRGRLRLSYRSPWSCRQDPSGASVIPGGRWRGGGILRVGREKASGVDAPRALIMQ